MISTLQAPEESALGEDDRSEEDMAFGLTDEATIRQFGGRIVAIWNRKVWGAGETYGEAWKNAQEGMANIPGPDYPPRNQIVFVPVPLPLPSEWIPAKYY